MRSLLSFSPQLQHACTHCKHSPHQPALSAQVLCKSGCVDNSRSNRRQQPQQQEQPQQQQPQPQLLSGPATTAAASATAAAVGVSYLCCCKSQPRLPHTLNHLCLTTTNSSAATNSASHNRGFSPAQSDRVWGSRPGRFLYMCVVGLVLGFRGLVYVCVCTCDGVLCWFGARLDSM